MESDNKTDLGIPYLDVEKINLKIRVKRLESKLRESESDNELLRIQIRLLQELSRGLSKPSNP